MAERSKSGGAARSGEGSGRALHAVRPESRGRLIPEADSPTRSPYQRDRDRILHSTAFRRLNYKTQVFVYHEGDHYRSRLTHSLEVAQIARSLARTLALDEDLAEAIALAHDLGHPPFGHAGEQALDRAMAGYGGFDHNAQSLAVVTALERKYAAFDGLNLTWETLEGLVKHNGPLLEVARGGEDTLPPQIAEYCARHDLELAGHPSAEAQAAALADDIAYTNHDIDDGFRAGLYGLQDLRAVPLTAHLLDEILSVYPELDGSRLIYEVNRRLITAMVDDVLAETRRRIAVLKPASAADIRAAGAPVVAFSRPMGEQCEALRGVLFDRVYRNERVMRIMGGAQALVANLFARYMEDPAALPEEWRERAGGDADARLAREVCNFIAGMTDRFAIAEHARLFDATPDLR